MMRSGLVALWYCFVPYFLQYKHMITLFKGFAAIDIVLLKRGLYAGLYPVRETTPAEQ